MISWWMFWRNLRSLLARRRAYRRRLPNRPVIKPVIGGVIDEQRKLAIVLEIIDDTHWRGEWNGQVYECRGLPDTDNLAVGDVAYCRVLPGTTELVSIYKPRAGGPELWFTDQMNWDDWTGARIWRYVEGADAPEFVGKVDDYELVTLIFWSKIYNCIFICTNTIDYDWDNAYVAIYKVKQHPTNPTFTKIYQSPPFEWGEEKPGYPTDALMDVAEFEDKIFFWSNTVGDYSKVLVFDPSTATMVEDVCIGRITNDEYGSYGSNGGIATDAGNGRLFASDGSFIFERIGPGNYTLDLNPSGRIPGSTWWTDDSYSMVTDWENDIIFHGVNGNEIDGAWYTVMERHNPTDTWALLNDEPGFAGVGSITYCNLFNHKTGALMSTFAGAYEGSEGFIIRKDNGGMWQRDLQLPFIDSPGSRWMSESCFATQSMAPMGSELYVLTRHLDLIYDPDSGWHPGPGSGAIRLWRRDSETGYVLLWESEDERYTFYMDYDTAGICAAPPPNATSAQLALMRRAHEVN